MKHKQEKNSGYIKQRQQQINMKTLTVLTVQRISVSPSGISHTLNDYPIDLTIFITHLQRLLTFAARQRKREYGPDAHPLNLPLT